MNGSVTIVRLRDYDDVFTDAVVVPEILQDGLEWIQQYCPLNEPTRVLLADLATAWHVPEPVISLGLRNLTRTGFFLLEE